MEVTSFKSRVRIGGLTAALALLALGVAAPGAGAFGLSGLVAQPTDTAAGEHHDFHIHINVDQPADQIKDLTVHLPPGMIGDPSATSDLCTETELNADNCPDEAKVGTTTSGVDVVGLLHQDVAGDIYNVAPHTGEPARLGIVLRPGVGEKIILQSTASLRQSDYGLDTVLQNLPNQAVIVPNVLTLPINITSLDLTLFGDTASRPAFMRNPTSCGQATTSFDATSYNDGPASGSASFTPTGCDQLDFSPTLGVTLGPGGTGTNEHPQLTTVIEQEETEAGLKRAQVFLPAETQSNNNALAHQCALSDFQAGNCAANTQIGEAHASSPLLAEELAGPAYLLATGSGSGLGVGLDLQGQLHLLIHGDFIFKPDFSQSGNLFDGLPDIPIANFALTIYGGDNGLLVATRDLCQPPAPVAEYDFTGHNGANITGTSDADIAGCAPPEPPTAKARLKRVESNNPVLKLKGKAGSVDLTQMRVKLPNGLRFADGAAFTNGTTATADGAELPSSAIHHGRFRAKVDSAGAVQRLGLRMAHGALQETKPIKQGRRLHFPVKLKDSNGDVTSLDVVAKAQ